MALYQVLQAWLNQLKSEEGQGMVEYGLILVLVAIAAIVALTALGGQLTPIFEQVTAALGVGG